MNSFDDDLDPAFRNIQRYVTNSSYKARCDAYDAESGKLGAQQAHKEQQQRLALYAYHAALMSKDESESAPAQSPATPAPVAQPKETTEQRQDGRLRVCEAAGLVMPKSSAGRLPDGVGAVAAREGVTRQTFSSDVKAALKRRENATREGVTVHRA